MMRCMLSTKSEIQEERSVGTNRNQITNPCSRLIYEIFREVISLFRCARRENMLIVLCEFGIKLIGLAIEETVETIETFLQRPIGVRPRSRALLHRRQVPFSGRKRCITLLSQHFCHRCGTRSDASAHVWKTRVPVGDPAHSYRVMIAPRQQTCTRWRAQRSGVKARVTQTVLREPVNVGCWN